MLDLQQIEDMHMFGSLRHDAFVGSDHQQGRIDAADFGLTITCRPDPQRCLTPGSVVSAEVRSAADLPLMPAVLGDNTPRIAVAAEHRSPYGTFREARP